MLTLDESFELVSMPTNFRELLVETYQAPHRKYHNLSHITTMLKQCPSNKYDHSMANKALVEAILFHDFNYSEYPVAPGTNESGSIADYMRYISVKCFGFNVESIDQALEKLVVGAINATAYHTIDQQNLSFIAKLLLDLDLYSFSQPWELYLEDANKVKAEQLELWDDEIVLQGRRNFLQTILDRKSLYYIKKEWEIPARENIAKEFLKCL